jgi:hypothetical protein
MPKITANLGEKTTFEPIPAGTVLVSVATAVATTSGSGNEMIRVRLSTVAPEEYARRGIFTNFTLIDSAMWALENFMNAIGIDTPDDGDEEARANFEFDPDDFIGKELKVGIVIEQNEGFDAQNVVKSYYAADAGPAIGVAA